MERDRQPMLDVLRGAAILAVLVFHLRVATGWAALDRAIAPLIDLGWVGVDLFFVLSGFLVGRIILAETASAAGFDRPRFFARRALRLWPVLWLYLALLVLAGGGDGGRMALPVLLHVQNYADHVPSHLWSLAVEEHFYLVAALTLPPLLRRHGPVTVAWSLVALLVACPVLRCLALALGDSPRHVQWQTQYHADTIALGVLVAWASLYRPHWLARAGRHRRLLVGLAVAGLAILAGATDPRFRYGPGLTIAGAASACLLVAALGTTVARPMRALAWLGGIAYPLYIFHVSLGRVADAAATALGIDGPLAASAWRCAIAVAGAAAIAILVERPFMRLRGRHPAITHRIHHIATANSVQ